MLELKHEYYRLIAVTDRHGTDKSMSKEFYRERIDCIAKNIRYDFHNRLYVDFIEDPEGKPILRGLHTSVVEDLTETDKKLTVTTHNSIYILEKAVLSEHIYLEGEKNLVELYLSDGSHHFAKGIYYDSEGGIHELEVALHVGMFTDTALIQTVDGGYIVCRYYIGRGSWIKFYDTLHNQQEYDVPILIHNVGDEQLHISFEFERNKTWVIEPGASERIVPPNR